MKRFRYTWFVSCRFLPMFTAWAGREAIAGVAAFALSIALFCGNASAATISSLADKHHQRERAEQATRDGDYELAEKLFRERLTKHAGDTAAQLGLSFVLLKQRKLQDAFDMAARVLAVEPTSARAHALVGAALLAAGDFRQSSAQFHMALSFDPDEALAVAGLAMIDFYDNRMNASLVGLRRAVSIAPNEPDYWFNLAQAAARNEHYGEAADAYERFLRITPRADAERRARIHGLIDFLRYLGAQRGLNLASGASRVEVPFELVKNRPVVKARVNGEKEPLRFVIDTGSGMCVISSAAAERLHLHAVARGGMARAVGGGGRFEIVYGFLSSLQLNEARIENVPVYIRQFYNDQEPVDGYIGLSVLSRYLTSIDYGVRVLTLVRSGERTNYETAEESGGIEMPVRTTSSGFRSGEIHVEGVSKPLNFIIDTGASISVVSESLATREEMGRYALKPRLKVYGAAGVAEDVQMVLLPHLTLGSHTSANVTAVVLDMASINETTGFEQSGIIGGNVLANFRITFDFQRGVMWFEPATAPVTRQHGDVTRAVSQKAKKGL